MPINMNMCRRLAAGAFALCVGVADTATAQVADTAAHPEEAAVVEQSRTRLRFEKDGTGQRDVYVRLRIQSEAGVQHFGQLMFGYNAGNERMSIVFVRVKKPDGTAIETPQASVQDLSSPVQQFAPVYTDFRQKHVTVQSLRPGDVLEFNVVTSIHTPLAPGQFWAEYEFQADQIVLDEQLAIDLPADHPVTLKTRPGFESRITRQGERDVYEWTRAHTTREDDTSRKDSKPRTSEPPIAAVRLTTFQTWEQVGAWYASLESPQRIPTADIRKKANELVVGRVTERDKLEALYQFAASNFRYVSLSLGAGRYQPRAAADVLRDQYGDCKDKHTLLASLMEAAGLKASAVLINSTAKLDPTFPSPSQFDHVITRAMAGTEEIWLDTTAEVAPFGLISLPLRAKQALLVDHEGTARLVNTPENPPMRSVISEDVDATLAPGGALKAHVQLTFRGDSEVVMRTVFRNTPAAQWKTVLTELTTSGGLAGEVSDWKLSDPTALKDPFTIDFDLAVDRYADWTTNKISVSLPLAGLQTAAAGTVDIDSPEPLVLGGAPADAVYRLRLHVPPEVTVRAPLPVSIAHDYGEYRTSYTATGTTFTVDRLMTLRQSELPAGRRQEWAAFRRVIAADAGQKLGLESSVAVVASAAEGGKAADLSRSGYDALEAGNFTQAMTLLKRVVELEPRHATAWTNLGRAYLGLRRTEDAIAAFRKQAEINPYDEYAYRFLGEALEILQRFDEAESAFQKQLEVNPLDRWTHSRLGALYLERHRYDSAIVHLEKALALTPEKNSWFHLQLGKAHLNLSHDSEAMAAFDRAIEISPTPPAWNEIAYELAMRRVHLDRAQEYAESAVASITALSRGLDANRADNKSLSLADAIAAYWDTLGWVYYVKDDFSRAERYVQAAWRITQNSEVGDHLAQIYEKQGRRDDAISTYAQALAAERPAEEIREHLGRLVGAQQIASVVGKHREELSQARTVALTGRGAAGTTADFFVLFTAGGVEGVQFAGGDKALQPLENAVRSASFPGMFPEDGPAKILRRGIVACSVSGCTITLLLPSDATANR